MIIVNPFSVGQMSPAAQLAFAYANAARRTGNGTRKRRRAAKVGVRPLRSAPRRASAKRPARLVKGSAAAKRYMASIRRKRRR